jgi:putative ABC transport system ATP-binding protein
MPDSLSSAMFVRPGIRGLREHVSVLRMLSLILLGRPTLMTDDVAESGGGLAPAGAAQAAHAVPTVTVNTPAIEARGIGRRTPNDKQDWLIRDVSVKVHPGDRLAILGPSGAGKTVLLRALAMLDPLDAGTVHWRGHAVAAADVPSYRKQVVYLHQRPALLDGSVEDNLRYPFTLKSHRASRYDREKVLELLGHLDRDAAFLAKSSHSLSGGEAQLAALVRAVQLDPAVLLMDEPTASLDQPTACAVEVLLDGWLQAGQRERALVWVSHDRAQARRVTSRSLYVRGGRLDWEE